MLEHPLAVLGVQHLGVPLDAGEAAADVLERRHRRADVEASSVKPSGAAVTESPWDIQTLWCAGTPASRVPGSTTLTGVRPYSRAPVGDTSPPSAAGHDLEAVAHPEDRHARVEQRPVERRARPARTTDDGPPDSTIAFGLPGQHLRDRHGVRHDLGVDLRLAHPPGDQLGVLGTEVDDQDQVVLRHAASLSGIRMRRVFEAAQARHRQSRPSGRVDDASGPGRGGRVAGPCTAEQGKPSPGKGPLSEGAQEVDPLVQRRLDGAGYGCDW